MRILRAIVQPFVLAMFDPKVHILARRAIGFQPVCDHDAWRSRGFLQQLPHEPLRGASISSVLDKDVENESILIDGAPEPMFLSGHRDDDFVEMPFIPTNRRAATNAIGEFPTEFLRPEANALMADLNAACGEHLLNHPQAQRKTIIQPNRVGDHFRGKTMTTIEKITRRFHDPPHNPQFCYAPLS